DLGNFLMAVTMFWAYVQISQLIIQWSNNVVETASWYVLRLGPAWVGVSAFLLFFGFFAPFMILFSRWVKRKRRALTLGAPWSIFAQLVYCCRFSAPTFEWPGFAPALSEVRLCAGLGGGWRAACARFLSPRNILPHGGPRAVAVSAEHHDGSSRPTRQPSRSQ